MPHVVSISTAAELLRSVDRISVAGVSGAGKSTLSMRIAEARGLRYVSLDRDMRWLPGWTVRDREEQRRLHDAFVAEPRWVIDGTSVGLMETRLKRSDLFIWLRPSRWIALAGIVKRVTANYGRVRPDMADGCPEQLPDREFLNWIWTFEKTQAPRLITAIDTHAPDLPVCVLEKRQDATDLLRRAGIATG